jgi:alkanesulfonate monooxygenase SsuD/methylene tetrahydromethanopterin reductase-like flavin-dependent oxidoreductase (luciferase family)
MRIAISKRLAIENWPEAADYVVEAERLGVDDVWSAEAWGHDAVTPLAFLAARTTRLHAGGHPHPRPRRHDGHEPLRDVQ